MSARRYHVRGEAGAWRYVGQAWYVDESTGERVEHDHMRMAQVRDGLVFEVWAAPEDVRVLERGERLAG